MSSDALRASTCGVPSARYILVPCPVPTGPTRPARQVDHRAFAKSEPTGTSLLSIMPRRGTFKKIENENQFEDSVTDATVLEPLYATHSHVTRAPRRMADGQARRVHATQTNQMLCTLFLELPPPKQSHTSSASLPSSLFEMRRWCA